MCNISLFVGVRLLGIGRNQYIDIMNSYRAKVSHWRMLVGTFVTEEKPINSIH